MYTFQDKKGRDICLIPEVTAIIQEQFKSKWNSWKKPIRLFYVNRCYRYERPQSLRYREFTQFGVELLGGKSPDDKREVEGLAKKLIERTGVDFRFQPSVKRDLDYYIEDGFEIECPTLGAQKQVLGGGRYEGGIGFAIGIDRLIGAIYEHKRLKQS